MNAKSLLFCAAALLLAAIPAGAAPRGDTPRVRIAMLTDGGAWDDSSFNLSGREGLEALLNHFPIYANFVESDGPEDYARNLAELAERGYRLVIGIGILLAPDVEKMALAYPNTLFASVDGGSRTPPPNARSLLFRVEECAFPAGYLAAAWADLQDPADPAVAWIGGMRVESVTSFTVPFAEGVKHYNRKHRRRVRVLGDYIDSFTDAAKAGELAGRFLSEGADVVFAPAGEAGVGALDAAKKAKKWAIGVDGDQYETLYDVRDILLTSCVKRIDRAVMQLCVAVCENQFWGGGCYEGRLANNGVGLAPYHDYEFKLPDALKREIQDIQRDIAAGTLSPFGKN